MGCDVRSIGSLWTKRINSHVDSPPPQDRMEGRRASTSATTAVVVRAHLKRVCASRDPAVNVDLHAAVDRAGDLGKHLDGGRGGVQLSCPVIRDPDAVHSVSNT